MDGYLDMREGELYIVRGGVLTPLPDPIELEADTLVDYTTVRTLDADALGSIVSCKLRGELAKVLPRVWQLSESDVSIAGRRYTARLMVIPKGK